MKKILSVFAVTIISAVCVFSQTATPKPSPAPTPPAADDTEVVKISTNLIQIDVTVTDSKGKVVTDLKPNEIEIYENGEKQKITSFSFVSAAGANRSSSAAEKPKSVDKDGVPVPQAVLRPEQIRRTFALVVDDLSLSFESAYQTRRALKKFVDEQMLDGDLVAIIRTGAGIGALQQFTSDKRVLYAAIEKVKWNPLGNGGIGAFAPVYTPLPTDTPETDDDEATSTGAGQSFDDFRGSVFATGTLGALKYIVSGMASLPGRKSVILFSDGFKLFETDANGIKTGGRVLEFVKQLVDLANRSSVVFYTVDARGLQYAGLTAEDSVEDPTGDALNKTSQSRRDQLFDTQESLSFLADETGGLAIKNTNDLGGGVLRILEDQSYYLVAYEPDTDTFDATKRKFNKLEVKVLRKGVGARYRSGFFNVAERVPEKTTAAVSPQAQLESALVSPFAVGGITLRLNALFGSDAKTGEYVRSLLHIDAADLKFTDDKDGAKKAVFDVIAMSFGDNGQVIDQLGKSYTLTVKPAALDQIVQHGFVYQFTFPVKKPGAYQYRVAIRDGQSGRLGSASQFIDVPNLKKDRLTTSSIILESMTADEWQKAADPAAMRPQTDPMSDTALRRVKIGTILRYGYEIYNAKAGPSKQVSLMTKIRVFRDGKLVLDGKQNPADLTGQTDLAHVKAAGALAMGDKMPPGDYILQIIVTDTQAPAKRQIATQFVQFEVVG